jgi:hypothetical protein
MSKVHRSVVRNRSYTRSQVENIERHNERSNKYYGNGDVDLTRTSMNVHFKQAEGSYLQAFDKMLEDGVISTRGHRKSGRNAIMAELIFDINTEYFYSKGEKMGIGGYEYANRFYEEAYRMACKQIGGEHGAEYGEQFVLSAVLHADERNKGISEHLGRDVYHYHLHVVYIPVVKNEVLWTKRAKPELVGTIKEVINQVSHSKLWRSQKIVNEQGKEYLQKSYSLLQDRYFEHMRDAGFDGFERGEYGSTTEHLDVLDYKIQQDKMRAEVLDAEISDKSSQSEELDATISQKADEAHELSNEAENLQNLLLEKGNQLSAYDDKIKKKQERTAELNKKLKSAQEADRSMGEINEMGKKTLFGKIEATPDEWQAITNLAKEGITGRATIRTLRDKVKRTEGELSKTKERLRQQTHGVSETMEYFQAKARSPQRLREVVADIMRKPPENQQKQSLQRQEPNESRKHDHSL